jgi:hydroxypyruvate reductase
MISTPEQLRALFNAAVKSADPRVALRRYLPEPPQRAVVVGAGKASALMAAALEEAWPQTQLRGVVATRYGNSVPTRSIEIIESAHPVPDKNSEYAGRRMLREVSGLSAGDLVVALISGGGSSIAAVPAPGVTLEQKRDITSALLRSGATITEINAVRKHLSAIKGGRLATAAGPARVLTFAISDVPGDDPSIIASGPTVADMSTIDDVAAIAKRYGITIPGELRETPKPGEIESTVALIATPSQAIAAAMQRARELGFAPVDLGICEGESRELGVAHAVRAASAPRGTALISGGETVVTMTGAHGRGGRNLEYLLALAIELDGPPGVCAIAGDTDGQDGFENAAGAIVTADTLARARAMGMDARSMLAAHDSYTFFERLGDLVITGPTLTNVNALRAILVL